MKINIKGTNIKLSPSIHSYIEEKIGGLQKFLKNVDENLIEAWVEIGKPSKHHRRGNVFYAEANIDLPGRLLRAQASESDIYAAIDKIKDELQREVKRYKEKSITKNRRQGRSFKKARALSPLARFKKR